jgi:hypothetical protein
MIEPDAHSQSGGLSPADSAAVDALVQAELHVERVAPEHRDRAARVLALLQGLDVPVEHPERLVRATLDRLAAMAALPGEAGVPVQREGWVTDDSGLSPDDQDALEALIGAGYDPSRVSSSLRRRAGEQHAILGLLATPLSEEQDRAAWDARRESLIGRTLAGVQSSIDAQEDRLEMQPTRRWSGLRLGDLVAAAAVLLIGGSLVLPVLSGMREQVRQTACLSNFQAAGLGFGLYAGDYRGGLPMASASPAGSPWWFVGQGPERSNSANLFTLARSNYAVLDSLRCGACCESPVGKPAPNATDWCCQAEVSLSFQNMFSRFRPGWSEGPRMVVLADRSPVVLSSMQQRPQDPCANSPNHGGRGQNVLFNDGAAEWTDHPIMPGGDNLWLPQAFEVAIDLVKRTGRPVILRGVEESSPGNTFLGP